MKTKAKKLQKLKLSRCKHGHDVKYRFRTAQGHLRCRVCLRNAQARFAAKAQTRVKAKRVLSNVSKVARPVSRLVARPVFSWARLWTDKYGIDPHLMGVQ